MKNTEKLTVKFTKNNANAKVPTKATDGSAGYDLYSCDTLYLTANFGRSAVNTGISMEIPKGYCGLVCPRSGMAIKNGVTVLNGPGVVDSDYRGEVKAILINEDTMNQYRISTGDKIAQIVFVKAEDVELMETALNNTDRGNGGFGSTGA